MKRKIRLYAAVTLAALFVAGCSGPCSKLDPIMAPKAGGGNASFSVYAALGTSIGAGYESGGLVYRHQLHAYPALFARQVGAAYEYPAISDSGLPALLRLVSLSPLVIAAGSHPGEPTNLTLARPYNNMCVPGALLLDALGLIPTRYSTGMFPVIQRGQGSIVDQVASLGPTFVSVEYGANEVLGPATSGSGTPVVPPAVFGAQLRLTLDSLQTYLPNAKLALFTVPDVTTIPFMTTVKPYVVNPADGSHIPLIGSGGLLSESDYVTLTAAAYLAAGVGIPVAAGGTGTPLPDEVVLTAAEATSIIAVVDAFNDSIAVEAARRGAAVVDLHGLLKTAATTGVEYGGVRYSSAFLTGGLFSLDGVHPSDFGQGLIANTMIDAVNARFGASIPHANLADMASASAERARPVPSEGGAAALPRIEGLKEALRALFGAR